MSLEEEPTQQLRPAPAADTTTALPGPLDLAGPGPSSTGDTDVLSLDQIFDEPEPDVPSAATQTPTQTPTRTPMPVVSVRSEPVATPERDPGPAPDRARAWPATFQRGQAWLRRDDNLLMVMTALVGIVLIVAVAALGV
jgi:hypothetical protein